MARGTKNALQDFIYDIPDSKLSGFPSSPHTLFENVNFRLDMQGMTSSGKWNLQIQANRQSKITAYRRIAPKTVSGPVLVSPNNPMAPDQIREAFCKLCP